MQKAEQRTSMKLGVLLAVVLVAFACCFMQVPQAHASEAWNSNVTVNATANPYDATAASTDYNQTINVTMTFASAVPSSIDATTAQAYLQSHTSIAGRLLNGTTSGFSTYIRPVDNVVVSGNTITFTVEPVNVVTTTNTDGTITNTYFTAIYSGEFEVTADATASSAFAGAMGNAPVETLINTGLGLTVTNSADKKSAVVTVSALPKCRAMNFALLSDGNSYIFTSGTSANGNGLTIHSHMFYQQTAANYAASLVSAANTAGAASLGYTFTNNGNGTFTITKTDGSALSGIRAVVYNGTYLNTRHLMVGTTTEPIWSE